MRFCIDLLHSRAHLCGYLGERLSARNDTGDRNTRLGLETSSGLVPRDDSCSEF
jgi:hypothetical protein